MGYQTALTAAALRSLRAVPPRVAEALLAFIFGSLASDPRRRGKPLQRELEGRWGARRGEYRVIYRLGRRHEDHVRPEDLSSLLPYMVSGRSLS